MRPLSLPLTALSGVAALAACAGPADPETRDPGSAPTTSSGAVTSSAPPPETTAPPTTPAPEAAAETGPPADTGTHEFAVTEHERFDQPWAMSFLPGTETPAITELHGAVKLRDSSGEVRDVSGVPEVQTGGQGGMADLIPGPTFATDGTVYLSWVEADGSGLTGGVVAKATLDTVQAALTNMTKIWEQTPKGDRRGHFSLRLAIQGDHLFVSSGERQEQRPAQETDNNLGSIIRLTLDGEPAPGNPFGDAPVTDQLYTIVHRNPLGLAFDADGRLWASEMGPQGGDELNLIQPGLNYGWPNASNGIHYNGKDIPDHAEGDGYEPPKVYWDPSISPGSLMIYSGDLFPNWQGDAFLGALSGEALIRVNLDGERAAMAENWPMGDRIRAVAEGPDGAIWLLEDKRGGHLLELRPA